MGREKREKEEEERRKRKKRKKEERERRGRKERKKGEGGNDVLEEGEIGLGLEKGWGSVGLSLGIHIRSLLVRTQGWLVGRSVELGM